jgi:3,4-dihydroxy-2-butanone 4-phosphate synthase
MEEQPLSAALEALRKGQCIVIIYLESREAKTNLFFPTTFLSPLFLKTLRTKTGGELYIFVAHEIASTFGFPIIGEVSTTHPQLFFFYFQQTPIISTF